MSLRPATGYHYHSEVQRQLKFSLILASFTALLTCLIGVASSQQATDAQTAFNSNAYRLGERLTYNVNYGQFVSAAHVELFVAGRDKFFGRDGIQLRAHVETNGVVNAALLSINNDYTTYIFPESGLPYRAQQVVRQAGRTSEASVDYNQPAGTDALPPQLRVGESAGTLDLLSALYRVRAMPLLPGSSYFTTVRHEGTEYRAEIKVAGKQLIKTNVGSFDAIETRVNVKSGPDYNVRAFFSNDEWHVPVLITARYEGADISIELAGSALTVPVKAPPPRAIDPRPSPTPITRGPLTPPVAPLDLPFKVGEQLNYRVFLANAATPIGSINFEIKSRGRFFNRDGLQFSVSAQTIGPAAFGVRDQITSYVDPTTLLPFRTEINLAEGKYHNVRTYNIDQDRGAATVEGGRERIEIPVGTHDIISAFYALRTFDLTIQRPNSISVMAIKDPRTLTVKATKRDIIELDGQKIPALQLQLTTDDPQSDRMQIRIWVGDDARHLPLRIAAITDLGAVRADLIVAPANAR